MHVPNNIWVPEVGLEPIKTLQDQTCRAQQEPIWDENKHDVVGDPIKMFLKEALARQIRNEMMENFTQILRWLPTWEAYSSSDHAIHFKVQVNFVIPLFEGMIDADVVDKWLNLLEEYFSVHNFFNRENITFALKVVPHVKDWWDSYSEKRALEEYTMFVVSPT